MKLLQNMLSIQYRTCDVSLEKWILVSIILLALVLRVWGINFGLPYIYHPDEPRYVISAQLLFKTQNLDPQSLPDISSSSFVYVVNALAYIPYYLAGKLVGAFDSPLDIPAPTMLAMGVGKTSMPTTFLLGRAVTVLFSIANIILVFLIGRQLFRNVTIGLLAAAMLAISPTNVIHSRFVTPDTFVVFFALLAFLETVYICYYNKPIHYILFGVALGCVVSSKINGVLIALPLIVAYFYRRGIKGLLEPSLYLIPITTGLAFVATTPYILWNVSDVIGDILSEGRHYSTGHAGMEGNSLVWYLNYMWQTAGVIYILATLEILRGIYLRSKETILLSIFPIVYFVFISIFVVRNDRTLLPLTPFLFLLAASFLTYLLNKASRLQPKVWRKMFISAIVCLSIVGLIQPTSATIENAIQLTTVDSRETARIWIANNLPAGSKIAIESYSPFVDPSRFSVHGFGRMIDHEPEWYTEQGFDYLIFSQGMYGRFYREPARYASEISQYESLFSRFEPVKIFTDGGYEIRVYKVK